MAQIDTLRLRRMLVDGGLDFRAATDFIRALDEEIQQYTTRTLERAEQERESARALAEAQAEAARWTRLYNRAIRAMVGFAVIANVVVWTLLASGALG